MFKFKDLNHNKFWICDLSKNKIVFLMKINCYKNSQFKIIRKEHLDKTKIKIYKS